MFEKEAEEYTVEHHCKKCWMKDADGDSKCTGFDFCGRNKDWQDGAEFGYNKANEWHYNGVPENENDILCQIDKDIFVIGYFHQKNKQYYTTSGEWLKTVIAWKEIVLPKESE